MFVGFRTMFLRLRGHTTTCRCSSRSVEADCEAWSGSEKIVTDCVLGCHPVGVYVRYLPGLPSPAHMALWILAGPESLIELRKPGSRTLSLGTVTLSLAPKPAGTLNHLCTCLKSSWAASYENFQGEETHNCVLGVAVSGDARLQELQKSHVLSLGNASEAAWWLDCEV